MADQFDETNVGAQPTVELVTTNQPTVELISEGQYAVEFVIQSQPVVEVVASTQPVVELVSNKGEPGKDAVLPEWVQNTKITVSNQAPPSPSIGDLWIDTN